MRVNELLARVDEDELFDIRCKSWNFCIQGTKWEITHSDTFMDNHFGDMLVTHIEVNDSPRGHAITLLVDQEGVYKMIFVFITFMIILWMIMMSG